MRYISTRGQSPAIGFADVLLAGPAPDGGLYLPESWPQFSWAQIEGLGKFSYADAAFRVLKPFVGNAFTSDELKTDIDAAYATFTDPKTVPLVEFDKDRYLLELFHGPTFAFKDVAMQLLGRMFARVLAKRGARATVVVATSGDTGSAAIAALAGRPNTHIVVLHPKGRTSDVQRRQMTSVAEANVHNIALEGTFDDTQGIVKALFADQAFAASVNLAAMNSINFARIAAQCVYYFTAAAALGKRANFVVPTGNFGDVFAGEAAARMGVQMGALVVATNENDILARALKTGIYQAGEAHATLSPSMDIQVASNFERALFEASDRDANWVATAMKDFAVTKKLVIPQPVLENLRARYEAGSATDEDTLNTILFMQSRTGHIVDPHTAVGLAVADRLQLAGPHVFLATAHPAKFGAAIKRATLREPELPAPLAAVMTREERYTVLPNDVAKVREFILERTHA